jgi:hypothetical protein
MRVACLLGGVRFDRCDERLDELMESIGIAMYRSAIRSCYMLYGKTKGMISMNNGEFQLEVQVDVS